MELALNTQPFNFNKAVQLSAKLKVSNPRAAQDAFELAKHKKNAQVAIANVLNHLNFNCLLGSLDYCIKTNSSRLFLTQTILNSFMACLNTQPHVDARNHATFKLIEKLKSKSDKFGQLKPESNPWFHNGRVDEVDVKKLNELLNVLQQLGSVQDASEVLSTCILKMHPTLQQLFARAFKNAMQSLYASHLLNEVALSADDLKIAEYVSACGASISMPYI